LSVTAITIIDLSLEGSPNFAVTEFSEVRKESWALSGFW
jgi:hypothetical protein